MRRRAILRGLPSFSMTGGTMKHTPYEGHESYNKRAGLSIVSFDGKCLWCGGRLEGIAFHDQIPLYCNATHKRHYRRHRRRRARDNPPGDTLIHACRHCGKEFTTRSRARVQACSVFCLLMAQDMDRYNRCWRKIAHHTKRLATFAAWRLAQDTGDHGVAPYLCALCSYWHIGHYTKKDGCQLADS